jgi:hypothetical protein
MKTLAMLTAFAFGLLGLVWAFRHASETRRLFIALFSCLTLFSLGRELIKRL